MKSALNIFGSNGTVFMFVSSIIVNLINVVKKAAGLFVVQKKSEPGLLMLPSGNDHRSLIESSKYGDFYSAPVVIRRYAVRQ